MELKQLIMLADTAYGDGLVQQYFECPDEDHGDTLAEFIVRELRSTFDATATDRDQLVEADRVMGCAVRELQDVVGQIGNALEVLDAKEGMRSVPMTAWCPVCARITMCLYKGAADRILCQDCGRLHDLSVEERGVLTLMRKLMDKAHAERKG